MLGSGSSTLHCPIVHHDREYATAYGTQAGSLNPMNHAERGETVSAITWPPSPVDFDGRTLCEAV
jgi:hypothetical protein